MNKRSGRYGVKNSFCSFYFILFLFLFISSIYFILQAIYKILHIWRYQISRINGEGQDVVKLITRPLIKL